MARQVAIIFLTNALLLWILQMVNHALTPLKFQLILPGVLITLAALNLRHSSALLCAGLTGLWIDAVHPSPFGFFAMLFLMATYALFRIRRQWHREQRRKAYGLCHLVNLSIVVAAGLLLAGPAILNAAYWLRLSMDLAASHLVLLAIAPWFFSLQLKSLQWGGVDLDREEAD